MIHTSNKRRATTTTASMVAPGISACLLLALAPSVRSSSSSSNSNIFQSNYNHCDPINFALPPALTAAYSAGFGGLPGAVPGPPLELFATIVGLKGGWTPGIQLYETPLAVRFTHLVDVMNWNCAAAYSENWLDGLTKTDPTIRAPATQEVDGGVTVDTHVSSVRQLCMVHAWSTVIDDWVPEARPGMEAALSSLGYNVSYGYDAEVDAMFDMGQTGLVSDMDGLAALAGERCYSPRIVGAIVGRQMTEYARRDGYNMYGDLNRDGTPCESNCRRYADPTNYRPVHDEGKLRKRKDRLQKTRWRPLEEDNGRGYTVRQQHVTPHIGTLAMPAILSRADVDSRRAPKPRYNYNAEVALVTQRLRTTALNADNEKELIEFFDDKIAVTFKVVEAVAAHGTSFEQTLNFVLGVTASEYDATLVAWKEKVRHDLVRPTTWIRDQMPDELFSTYAGPYEGVGELRGKNFDAWVRVMPHSEHVSGSGCICQALMEFVDGWMEATDGQLAPPGQAPSTYVSGVSISVPLATDAPGGREAPFLAGSSRTEPGATPETDVTVVVESMMALRDACGKSRLDGGMHFTKSVPAAYKLCSGIGTQGVDYALDLLGTGGW